MKIRSMSHEYRMNEQWYAMPPQCRKSYRDNLQALRQRERHLLNQFVEEMVVEELGNDLAYWERELDKAVDEVCRAVDDYTEDERLFDRYGDEIDWDYHDMRIGELRKRIDTAYREWIAAA